MKLLAVILVVSVSALPCSALTLGELADVFDAMESSIRDVVVEFEWSNQKQLTEEDVRGTGQAFPVSKEICSFATARPFSELQSYSQKVDLSTERGETFLSDNRYAYNGDVLKHLTIGALDERPPHGTITKRRDVIREWTITPMAFTILRGIKEGLLSQALREHPEAFRLVDGIHQIREFRTVELDFVTPQGVVHRRYFFSVDHGYAPVRYEWLDVSNGKIKAEVDILALKEVSAGLWFPIKGTTGHVADESPNVYEAKDVKVNQNLSKAYFYLEFPPRTAVIDEIANIQYTYKPTELQLEAWMEKDADLAKAVSANSAETKARGDQLSASEEMNDDKINNSSRRTVWGISVPTFVICLIVLIAAIGGIVLYRTSQCR